MFEYKELRKRCLRYKYQSKLLDKLASYSSPVSIMELNRIVPLNNGINEMKILYEEFSFLQFIGVCELCDSDGNKVYSKEQVADLIFKQHKEVCSRLTETGKNLVRNRTYESLFISSYLNYRILVLSMITFGISMISLLISLLIVLSE